MQCHEQKHNSAEPKFRIDFECSGRQRSASCCGIPTFLRPSVINVSCARINRMIPPFFHVRLCFSDRHAAPIPSRTPCFGNEPRSLRLRIRSVKNFPTSSNKFVVNAADVCGVLSPPCSTPLILKPVRRPLICGRDAARNPPPTRAPSRR